MLHAIGRMSWRMRLYMVRRLLRNLLAIRCPNWYRSRIRNQESRLPAFETRQPLGPGIRGIVDFYCSEYRDLIDGACAGRLTLHGRTMDFGSPLQVDWTRRVPEEGDHQMWRVKLAHMGFICPMLAEGNGTHHRAVLDLIKGFRMRASLTAPEAFGAWWFPYAVSHRILAVGSGLMAARQKGCLDPEVDEVVAGFLKENAAFLLDNIEHELCNNHVERNVAALCLYFMGTGNVPSDVISRLERDITQIVAATVLGDGTQAERSPMYQGLCVASLGVMAEAPFLSEALRTELAAKLNAARDAFAVLCHPDGEVALFNDSWHAEVPRWTGPAAAEGRTVLPQGGYARLSAGADVCLFDAGPLGPSWNAGHGHADFLSLEISLNGSRLLVDPGTSRYNTGPDRARERSAQAHNGPAWTGHEPVEFLGCFKIGRMAEAHLLDVAKLPPLVVAGRLTTQIGTAMRMIRQYPGAGFLIADLWSHDRHPAQVTWLIPGHFQVDQMAHVLSVRDGRSESGAVMESLIASQVDAPAAASCASHYGTLDPAWSLLVRPIVTHHRQHAAMWVGHHRAPATAAADARAMLQQLEQFAESVQ